MRPVRLELNGFASFRDPAVVDFVDADYFALVGPTGSGKSTILDALTFALYGSAYRWGRTNAIAYALAPTSNRCTVSLTFDVGSQRYQVAREVRRVGQQIQQKAVSLVRFADPNAVTLDPHGPQPDVLAGEIKELNAAIVDLLGLDFDDFCQCVVLPQGEFARFLSANAAARQQILLKLLGAAHYEGIGKRAGARAAEAAKAVEVLTDQLATHAEATPQAEATARATQAALEQLATTVDRLVPQITGAQTRAATAAALALTLRSETNLLAQVVTPHGLRDLQRSAAEADAALQKAKDELEAATQALTDATAAAHSGPQRALLEVTGRQHNEQASLLARRHEVADRATTTAADVERLRAALATAVAAVAAARDQADQANERHRRLDETGTALTRRHQLLTAVRAPDGVHDLTGRARTATRRVRDTAAALRQAQERHTAATEALTRAADPRRLDEARSELAQLRRTRDELATATDKLETAVAGATQAERQVTAALEILDRAQKALEEARTRAGSAQLRRHLQLGHACPVCEQTVTTLPPPLTDTGLEQARTGHQAAIATHQDAVAAHKAATALASDGQRSVDTLTERHTQTDHRLVALLPARPAGENRDSAGDRAHLDELTATRARLDEAAAQARAVLATATVHHDEATAALTVLDRDLTQARARIHTLLGTLTELDPPTVEVDDLAGAWAALQTWATVQAASVGEELATLVAQITEADVARRTAAQTLQAAETGRESAQDAHTEAVRAATAAAQDHENLTTRLAELATRLATAPGVDELPKLLSECDRLDAEVETAKQEVAAARQSTATAADEQEAWRTQTTAARTALLQVRDAIGALAPPPVDTDDLTAGWATLTAWAQQAIADRTDKVHHAHAEENAATNEKQDLTRQLNVLLVEHDLGPDLLDEDPSQITQAPRIIAVAAERARGKVEAIARSIHEAAAIRDKIDAARTAQQVAAELAGLMRANRFPQWLAEAALDTLVAGASESLRRLSGDQFDLTHRKGDFYVIDHADADSQRSVRTLSGGETFQASLALALALSAQLAGLGGGTKLESIFLDEGFGTLDPDTLETVAGTLENLAQGERMVGVITHVPALAERAPVRYRVRRDTRTSVITREGA